METKRINGIRTCKVCGRNCNTLWTNKFGSLSACEHHDENVVHNKIIERRK